MKQPEQCETATSAFKNGRYIVTYETVSPLGLVRPKKRYFCGFKDADEAKKYLLQNNAHMINRELLVTYCIITPKAIENL